MIEIQSLTRDYGEGRGIFDVSFSVSAGEVFGFLGLNGAGKTTTIRHLMGFLRPKAGECSINGLDCWKNRTQIQGSLGYIPGEMALPADMTGADFLRFYTKYRGMKNTKRQEELLKRFELDTRGKIRRMSKGMKQKVGIVAALMHDPDVLVLDEPTSGLDPLMQNRFTEFILEEKERGKTILMSSHMFEEVERTCHRVGIIKDGRIITIDSVDALKAAQTKKYIVTLDNEDDAVRLSHEALHTDQMNGNQVTVLVQNNIRQFISILSRYPVINFAAPEQSLEEIFLQHYGGESK